MNTLYSLLFVAFISCTSTFGQLVQSKSYEVMLDKLLDHNVKEISATEAKNNSKAVFLDAREKGEFDVSHIEGAIWVGYDDFNLKRLNNVTKDKEIIVYCSVGYRSEKVTEKLKKAGYTTVANMVGGIFEWKNLNYPVVNSSGNSTEKVHAYDRTWGIWLNKGEKVYK